MLFIYSAFIGITPTRFFILLFPPEVSATNFRGRGVVGLNLAVAVSE